MAIQRRSADSVLLGFTWYQSSFDISDPENASILVFSNNMNRIKLYQANIGVGYGYNLVPFRGFTMNLMAMPTFSVYNHVKVEKSECNYVLTGGKGESRADYGEWNKQTRTWANGKKQMSIELTDGEEWFDNIDVWDGESESNDGAVRFNVDVRLGMVYNWRNAFIGLQMRFSRFAYQHNENHVLLIDSYARFSLGIRL